jgi:twitching motility protein PilJ
MAISKPNAVFGKVFGRLSGKVGPGISHFAQRWTSLDPDRIPLLSAIKPAQRQTFLVVLLVVSLLVAAGLLFTNTLQVGNRAEYIEISTRLQMLSQRYTKTAQQAVLGNKFAFGQLEDSRKAFAEGLNTLIDGGAKVPSSPGYMQGELDQLKKRWEDSRKNIQYLIAQQGMLVELGQALNEINQRNNELLDLAEQVVALLPSDSRKQLAFANQQALWTQRMAKNANALLALGRDQSRDGVPARPGFEDLPRSADGLLKGSTQLGVWR